MANIKFLVAAATLAIGALVSTPSFAIPIVGDLDIDFRTAAWAGANGQTNFSVGSVTAVALPRGSLLYQDGIDGLGVQGGEPDEIDGEQRLRINFGGGANLTGVWLTDLFGPPDGPGGDGEEGRVNLRLFDVVGNVIFDFVGTESILTNGELFVDFGGVINADRATFRIIGGEFNNEYSVAGFTTAVPEPATLTLLGAGLVGLGLLKRRKAA